MRDQRIGEFLRELASPAPTPGGGAAAALAGALAAALVGMVAGLAARRGEGTEEVVGKAEELREGLLSLAQRDAEAYGQVDAALKLPKGTEGEQEARRRALQAALKGAAEVPLATARRATQVLHLAGDLLPRCPKSARSDLASAGALALAAARAALYNVDANCLSIKDPGFLMDMATKRAAVAESAGAEAEEIRRALEPALQGWLNR